MFENNKVGSLYIKNTIAYIFFIICLTFVCLYFDRMQTTKEVVVLFAIENVILLLFTTIYVYSNNRNNIIGILLIGGFIVSNNIFIVETLVNMNFEFWGIEKYAYNCLIYVVIYIFIHIICNSFKVSIIANNIIWLVFSILNCVVTEFRGRPIFISDIYSLGTAIDVMDTYKFKISLAVVVLCLGAILFTIYELYLTKVFVLYDFRFEQKARVTLLCGTIIFISLICNDRIMHKFGVWPNLWDHTANGYAASVIVDIKCQFNEKIDNYDPNEVKTIADNYTFEDTKNNLSGRGYPDIVVVMSESYCDYNMLDEQYTTNEKVTPFIDSINDNIIKGKLYTSVYGGGTANTEYEFLTGDSMLVYQVGKTPYQTTFNNREHIYSIVDRMNDLGYKTIAMHPYTESNWNRPSVYKAMGFDECIFINDYKNTDTLREYISDEANYLEIIEQLKSANEEPVFIFNISMQNHGAYTGVTNEFDQGISLEEDFPIAEGYLNLINATDDANKMLIEYLKKREKDTVFLLFGDHQPSIEEEFIEMLISPENTQALTQQEISKKYITNFFLWANYDIEEYKVENISVNYLQTLLFNVTGLPKTKYMKYLSDLYEEYPVVTAVSIYDNKGNYYYPLSEDIDLYRIEQYKRIIYNHSIDEKGAVESFY